MDILFKFLRLGFFPALISPLVIFNINLFELRKKDFFYMFLSLMIGTLFLSRINLSVASIYIYLVPSIFLYIRSRKLLQSIILNALSIFIMIMTDNFISLIMIKLCKYKLVLYSWNDIVILSIILLAVYLVSYIIGKFLKKYSSFILNNYKNKYMMLIYLIILVITILFIININWNSSRDSVFLTNLNSLVFVIYSFLVMVMCSILIFAIKKDEVFKAKQIQLENLEEYTSNLEALYTDMRKFRHDYINILSSMAGFIDAKDLTGLEEHFNKHIYPLNNEMNKNNYKLGLLKNIEIPSLKGIISSKVIRAQELGLDAVIDIVEPVDKINMDIIDLSRSIGILIDNAIEAALESEDKKLNIGIIKKNSSIIIVIINSYSGIIPPISKLFKEGFSTKGQNRGLGLSNLKDIINKYTNVTIDTYTENNKFIQELTIS